ncbi:MAG: MFS transporter [Acidimicrobiia bacterium]
MTVTVSETQPVAATRRWSTLAVVAFATAMIILDATVVAVALPTMISDLGLSITTAEWVTTIYTVAFAALLIPMGQVVDRIGGRRMIMIGVTLFALGSVGAGLAHGPALLLTSRLLQGISGAFILPASLATLTALFTDRARPIAFGVWGAVIGGMAALGPLVGGWLTTNVSWRAVFFVNVPIGLIIWVAALLVMTGSITGKRPGRIDIAGGSLVALALAMVTYGLVQGQRFGWVRAIRTSSFGPLTWPAHGPSQSVIAFGIALVTGAVFAVRERRRAAAGRPTYLAWELFELRGFRFGNLAGAAVNFGELGLVFVLPLYLQAVLGLSAWGAGLILMGLAAGAFIGGPAAASVARHRGERFVVLSGVVTLMVAIAGAAAVIGPTTSSIHLVPWLALAGLGIGSVQAQLSSVILDEVPAPLSGQASGTQSTFRQLGATFGVAIVGAVLTMSLASGVRTTLETNTSLPSPQVSQITDALARSGGTALIGLRTDPSLAAALPLIDDAAARAARDAMLVTIGGFVVALGAGALLPKQTQR